MPSARALNSIVANQSHENREGRQLRSQESISREMPLPHRPVGSSLNWGPNNLEDVTFLRLPEVKAITGLSKSSLYVLIRENRFPSPVRLGSRAVAWVRSEVKQWAADRVTASRSGL